MRKNIHVSIILATIALFLMGCKKDNEFEDLISIEEYITENNLTIDAETSTGVKAVINVPGTAAKPNSNSTVTVAYRGYLTNGSVFDQSAESGITFSLAQVIPGWRDGIPLFGEGGEGILLIPASQGYGAFPPPGSAIPPNADLVFDVELIDF